MSKLTPSFASHAKLYMVRGRETRITLRYLPDAVPPTDQLVGLLFSDGGPSIGTNLKIMGRRSCSKYRSSRGVRPPGVEARIVHLSPQAVRRIAHRYPKPGLDGALFERPGRGSEERLDASEKQHMTTTNWIGRWTKNMSMALRR
jgi:hypothetical protein